jgi:1-hydroxycarotenoid 3,4-desaturase
MPRTHLSTPESAGASSATHSKPLSANDTAGFPSAFPSKWGSPLRAGDTRVTSVFSRPGSTTDLPGLYLAGGSVHPGPGVPMAVLSGSERPRP